MNIKHNLESDGTQSVNVEFSSPDEIVDYFGMVSYINITNYIFENKDKIPKEELANKIYDTIIKQMDIIIKSSEDINKNPDKFDIQTYIDQLTSVLNII